AAEPTTENSYALSLTAALPISAGAAGCDPAAGSRGCARPECRAPEHPVVRWFAGRSSRPGHRRSVHLSNGRSSVGQSEVSRGSRSEEHTSELQSRENLLCRLLL